MVSVNPEVLRWARETAGLSLEEAAKKIGLKEARGKTGGKRLGDLEQGLQEPSRSLLNKMSNAYRRPLLVFYLKEPPGKGDRGKDFRTLSGNRPVREEPWLDALIRRTRASQEIVKELLIDEESKPLSFIGSFNLSASPKDVANDIIRTIGFQLPQFRKKEARNSFRYLRERLESKGVFVLLLGDLGSYHTKISVETFRGFALSDPIAPFIVINDKDARVSFPFTALHETAHLWLGKSGISAQEHEIDIERFCNSVAGEILLPDKDVQFFERPTSGKIEDWVDEISSFAEEVKLSRAMIAYRLLISGIVNHSTLKQLNEQFTKERLESQKDQNLKQGNIKIDRKVLQRRSLGPALLELVKRNISEGSLTPTKAGILLGVKPRNVFPLLYETPNRGVS